AQQVNHFESSGLKQVKYGEPDARKMSKEILDVVRAALQVALFYRIEQEVEARFEEAFTAIGREG
ncbi:MAG TPA: hypothetical protein VER55_06095, partial [Ardenticatenaceae bacterium]|nr:hypothetical protein [Ardenticatenaceae bacterium]